MMVWMLTRNGTSFVLFLAGCLAYWRGAGYFCRIVKREQTNIGLGTWGIARAFYGGWVMDDLYEWHDTVRFNEWRL